MLELARRAKVGREQVRRMTVKAPSAVLAAIRIAKALDVSVEWLFDGDGTDEEKRNASSTAPPARSSSDEVNLDVLRRELKKLLEHPSPPHQS